MKGKVVSKNSVETVNVPITPLMDGESPGGKDVK
jgi:hypothetical protein